MTRLAQQLLEHSMGIAVRILDSPGMDSLVGQAWRVSDEYSEQMFAINPEHLLLALALAVLQWGSHITMRSCVGLQLSHADRYLTGTAMFTSFPSLNGIR